jgi:hypothetical protein
MPMAAASQRGVSGVAAAAAECRVVLTSHGRPVAVVEAAERLDDDVRRLREAALAAVSLVADRVASTAPATTSLEEICERLGVDVQVVRQRADALASRHSEP